MNFSIPLFLTPLSQQLLTSCVQSCTFLHQLVFYNPIGSTSLHTLWRLGGFWHKWAGPEIHSDSKVAFSQFWVFLAASKERPVFQGSPSTSRLQLELWQCSFRAAINSTILAGSCNGSLLHTPCLEQHLWRWACEVWANPVLPSSSFDMPFLLVT